MEKNNSSDDWIKKIDPFGKIYYYNTKTKNKSWKKPTITSAPEKEWKIMKTSTGQEFYYNTKLKKSFAQKPLQKNEENNNKNKIINKKEEIIDYDESRKILYSLFKDVGVDSQSRWDKYFDILQKDKRFKIIQNFKDKKIIFKEYVENEKNIYKRKIIDRKLEAKKDFKKMLEEYGYINTEMKFKNLIPIFYQDQRWQKMDDKEKEDTFQEYLEELFLIETENEKKVIKKKTEMIRQQFLELRGVTSSTTWDQIKEKMYYNNTWNELHDFYKLKTFKKFILNLKKLENEEKRKVLEKKERTRRLRFRDKIEDYIKKDKITTKTLWKDLVRKIKDKDWFYNILDEYYSHPRALFFDYKEELIFVQKEIKNLFKKILKNKIEKFYYGINLEDFKKILMESEKFNNFDICNSENFYFNYLHKKLLKRQKKSKKKIMRFFYENKIKEDDLNKIKEIIQNHKDKTYLQSLSEKDIKIFFKEFNTKLSDSSLLKKSSKNSLSSNFEKKKFSSVKSYEEKNNEEIEPGEIKKINYVKHY